jgi:pimeloyl-ACP methyl ester carboxylesterase
VVLDSVFELEPEAAKGLAVFYGSMTEENYHSAVADFVRKRLAAPSDDPEVIEAAVATMTTLAREVFVALGQGRLAFDGVAAARGVSVPALFIGAARPFSDLANVRRECPRWYVGRVVGSGHTLQLLVPDQVNAMIDRFLAQVEAGFPDESPEATF